MSNHYYSEQPTAKSSRLSWEIELRGLNMSFTSDAGVFSKKEVDFGTRLLLETCNLSEKAITILDVGCGYGPIGLTIAKERPESKVLLVDINERALELAQLNAIQNGIKNTTILKSYLLNEVNEETFNVIFSNPPIRAGKEVVHQLFEDAYAHLDDGGEFWIVIQKKQGAPSALKKLESLFDEVVIEKKVKGYYIIHSKKY
ncbi:class I SAM-dependent methyltransferase [Bacillaceae bacterium IKA-2]|nr:class I SAM-dependent methyltransferase [Bacillaceae bacterium IKA-2]